MHGSMGGGRRPATVGHAARRQAPLAYPTNLHHGVEPEATDLAIQDFRDALNQFEDEARRRLFASRADAIEKGVVELRTRRAALLDVLTPMRTHVVDLVMEEHAMPDGGMLGIDVEPLAVPAAPRPVAVQLDVLNRLKILAATAAWTRTASYGNAPLIVGPVYTLHLAVQHPTPEAKRMWEDTKKAQSKLQSFLGSAWPTKPTWELEL
jgi:hypothetical protein